MADNDKSLGDWGIKICPVRNKQCLEEQCAWWLENESMCSVKKSGLAVFPGKPAE